MQTHWQSRLEIGMDLGMSLLVNLGVQMLFYGSLATPGRSSAFAGLVLGLATVRRYTTRRVFNRLLPRGGLQPRWHSWAEVVVDTVLAIGVAIVLQRLFYGAAATWSKAGGLTGVVYAITMGRRYALRRGFETWAARQAALQVPAALRHPESL